MKITLFYCAALLALMVTRCAFNDLGRPFSSTTTVEPVLTWTPLPTLQKRPAFVTNVTPPESYATSIDLFHYSNPDVEIIGGPNEDDAQILGYSSEICVTFDFESLVQSGDDFTVDGSTRERITLTINDDGLETPQYKLGGLVLVSRQGQFGTPDTKWGDYEIFCWKVDLDVGIHDLILQFRQSSGTIREYAWQMALTEEKPPRPSPTPSVTPAGTPVPRPTLSKMPKPVPTPAYIESLSPDSGSILESGTFNNELCIGIYPDLIQLKPAVAPQAVVSNLKVLLNGKPIEDAQAPFTNGATTLRSVTHQIGTTTPSVSPVTLCWPFVKLEAGLYEAELQLEQHANDIISYKWLFTIQGEEGTNP